ncbi:hypothetical protein Syn7502_03400 [Synechococcus sp. PCC 7502]|uniref:hypothetical protein n=1 Tax=Synechococcus sp. PCC 7502 TaxID=1173263 RepID=UPI00029FC30E|nr:hypothetical protein [Synechococcus sp. PCC 7502]AFY75252.1 hypothetical protein Syn7502_03400 [Synechococcus sp. PCC 7502]
MAIVDINALALTGAIDENGSKKWQKYTSDTGDVYAVNIDKNIGVALGFDDYAATDGTIAEKPASLTMR